jgi:hypothetical protein
VQTSTPSTTSPSTVVRQHEPDRTTGPAADRRLEKAQPTPSSSAASSATDDTGPGQGKSTPPAGSQDQASGGSQPVTVAVDTTKVSASVAAAGVKASVSIDLQKPQDTQITIKSDKAGNRGIDTKKVTDHVSGTVNKVVKDLGKH